ncbi:GNAT family N-acetyltransferase [Paenibacillus agri]|uniref:GNAT family N-acetyltransferase n=1 Tax=Paenibacillus agri TaxID=2744309 RepID=UPI001FE8788A|nr:GNAT family N-acetyltransferase [Paenibacillus agri]
METHRCNLTRLQQSDYQAVKTLYGNEQVRTYLGGAIPEEHALNKFLDILQRSETDSYYWTVRLKISNEFIGLVSLEQHVDGQDTEISYELLPHSWGHGYAKEAVAQVLTYAFNELNLNRVIAETQTANHSSCKLLERVGMKLDRKIMRYDAEQALYGIDRI